MTFKAGDKVKYNQTFKYPEMEGWEAEVVNVGEDRKGLTRVRTTVPGGLEWAKVGTLGYYYTSNLELIDPPFTFADIKVGDKIRRTLTRDTGTTEVREGVVTKMGKCGELALDDGVPTSPSFILAYATDTHKATVVLELLDRPKPKHWTETKPVGSVAVILDGVFTKTLKKTSEFGWQVRYIEDEHTYKASNAEIKTRTAQWVSDKKLTWIK